MRKDYFKIAIRNLKTRSLRSWLTIIGIVIGVFLVMFLLSLSQGIKGAIMKQIQMMGSDVLMIYPGEGSNMLMSFSGNMKLTNEDIKLIGETEGVEKVIPQDWKGTTIRYGGKRETTFVYGIPFDESRDILVSRLGMEVKEGRFPIAERREVVLGDLVSKDIFPRIKIDDEMYIEGKQFKVVGFLKSLGNKNDDSMVGMNLNVFRKITGKREGAVFAMAIVEEGFNQNEVAEKIKKNLQEIRERRRGEDQPGVSVITSEKAMDMVGNILNIIQLAIFLIAAFAILVGAIGIMNSTYTSVRERTKEIGVMKAIGAKTNDISSLFLIESGIVGFIGGLGGVIIGVGGAELVELALKHSSTFVIEAHSSIVLILSGLFITSLVGCLSGFFPARQAARLKPIDALHYE